MEKRYGLPTAISMVVGIVIGSGVFIKGGKVLSLTGGNLLQGIAVVGIVGLICIICSLVFAELGSRYEKVNGIVDYAEVALGPKYAYYVGWFTTVIYTPAIVAMLAFFSAMMFLQLFGISAIDFANGQVNAVAIGVGAEDYDGRSVSLGEGLESYYQPMLKIGDPIEKRAGKKITLTFNLGSCTFCATCADFCSSHSIEFTGDYHMVATKEEDLLVSGSFIKAPRKKPAAPAKAEACAAAEPAKEAPKPREDGKPVNDPAKCVYCTLCAKKCPAGALTVDRAAKTWTLDEDKCVACGTCAEACPKNCIIL